MIRRLVMVALGAALLAPAASADVKLHPLFSDGMVLQQGKECAICGTANPGQQLRVTLTGEGSVASVSHIFKTPEDGKWTAHLKRIEKGDAFIIVDEGK